ncbi:MAG TPA: tail fiber protein [Ktedonobacterales bacterium]|nr:tail fiber protein [Ktedonobacterales bacterium]
MDPFLGEIRLFSGTYAPNNWALCNGQLMAISQNTALFSLLGTSYGGNGTSTFGLPNLQASVPLGMGQGPNLSQRVLGQVGGTVAVGLVPGNIPSHTHLPSSTAPGTAATPIGGYWAANTTRTNFYAPASPNATVAMAQGLVAPTGGTLQHENRQPFLVLNYIIALAGVFPPRP